MYQVLLFMVLSCSTVFGGDFQAGIARKNITPQSHIWMSGFGRKHGSEGVAQDLWAKALVLDDGREGQLVIVTMDLIGLPRDVSEPLAEKVMKNHHLERSQLLLCPSHTHSGPIVWPNLEFLFQGTDEERQVLQAYAEKLVEDLAGLVDAAFKDLSPAELASGHGTCDFAVNRREFTPEGVKFGENPEGPIDHDVPVLRITAPDGALRAVLFGYAAHNVVLGGSNFLIHGDYAGSAQAALEKDLPGVTTMYMILCAGDQNPRLPRGTMAVVDQRGRELADAVHRVLKDKTRLQPLSSPIHTAYETITLDFVPHNRALYEEDLKHENLFRRLRAERMLHQYDTGLPQRQLPYPVQVIRWGRDLTLVALAGEVVIDYALRLKREFPQENLVLAGYANEVPCYIPSVRIIREGGYEGDLNTALYGQPGIFEENVEETIISACRKLLRQTVQGAQ